MLIVDYQGKQCQLDTRSRGTVHLLSLALESFFLATRDIDIDIFAQLQLQYSLGFTFRHFPCEAAMADVAGAAAVVTPVNPGESTAVAEPTGSKG